MNGVVAVAVLRFRAGWSGRLGWLVPLTFLVGFGTGWWTDAATSADAAAQADRILLTSVTFAALLVAAVPTALGLPLAVRAGRAGTLLAAPVSRLAVVVGETLGGGLLASCLAVGMLLTGLLGVEASGHGAHRDPVRTARSILVEGDAVPELNRATPQVRLPFSVPRDVDPQAPLRVRIRPRLIHQGGDWPFEDRVRLGVGPVGKAAADTEVVFGLNVAFQADLPLNGLAPGDEAELVVEGGDGAWRVQLDDVEASGAPRSFAVQALLGVGCLVPLLFALSAVALVGAVRFGAPTAAGLVLAAVLLFGAQDIVESSALYVVETAAKARKADPHAGHDHGPHDDHDHGDDDDHEPEPDPHAGHDHGPVRVSPVQVALARGMLGVLTVVPPLDVFDRTGPLVDRRAVRPSDVGRAWGAALLPFAGALLLAWLLFRRREMIPL